MALERDLLFDLISAINNFQEFGLCMDFERLSLEDKPEVGTQPSTSGDLYPTDSFSSNFPHPNNWQQSIIESLKAQFVEHPAGTGNVVQSRLPSLNICWRLLPGSSDYPSSDFISQELRSPLVVAVLKFIKSSLGLSYYTSPMAPHDRASRGLKDLTDSSAPSKVLIEVLTEYSQRYGRILVLISLGLGCTAWYSFFSGDIHIHNNPFPPFDSYVPFLDHRHVAEGYERTHFSEAPTNVPAHVEAMFRSTPLLKEVVIPANGPTMQAVGLGLVIAFFLAAGMLPPALVSN